MLPVSSSAHLALLPWLVGWEQPADRTAFAASLHAGSCLGIAWAVRSDLRSLSRRELVLLAAASAPAAVVGYAAADVVEARLGTRPQLAGLLAAAGALLWLADRCPQTRPLDSGSVLAAGVAQLTALMPGVSRAGATLTALRGRGVERAAARRFALLMSLPVTAGAAGLTVFRTPPGSRRTLRGPMLLGVPAAAGVAAAAAAGQRRYGDVPLPVIALYRVGLAVLIAVRHHQEAR